MYKFLAKNGQLAAFGLGLLIVIILLVSIFSNPDQLAGIEDANPADITMFDFGLRAPIALLVLSAVAILAFGVMQIASDIKGSLKGIIGFAVLLLIFAITYNTASGEATGSIVSAVEKVEANGGVITEGNLKWVSSAVATGLIMSGIAVAAFVLSEIRNFFK